MKLIVTVKRKNDATKGFLMGLIGFIITLIVLMIIKYGFNKGRAYGVLNIVTIAIIIWSLWLVTLFFDLSTWKRASNTRTVLKIMLAWIIMFFLQWFVFARTLTIKAAAGNAMVLAIVTAFMYLGILLVGLLARQKKNRIILKTIIGTIFWIFGLFFIRWIGLRAGVVSTREIVINAIIVFFLAFASASAENPDDAILFYDYIGF
jgi:hypothetical protein